MYKLLLGAGAAALCHIAAHAQAPSSLAADAAAFGARESVDAVDLSPDGSKVLYLTPGPSRRTFAVIGDLSTGQFQKAVGSDGEPESLRWCNFASMKRLVCRFTGLAKSTGIDLLGFSRLIALDADGGNPKLLGQVDSFYDEHVRTYDGRIIDWLIDSEGVVLMNRLYMPEETKIQSLVKQTKKGFGVDKIDVTTLRRQAVEGPREDADYMTDGRGTVRLMSIIDSRHSGMLTGEMRYSYRTKGSRDWQPLHTVKDIQNPDFVPLAIDADRDSLYVLKKRAAALLSTPSGSMGAWRRRSLASTRASTSTTWFGSATGSG